MLVGLVTYAINLSAIMDLAVNMALVLNILAEEKTFAFVNLDGEENPVTDVYLIGIARNLILYQTFPPVSIQMTAYVQHQV